MANINLNNAKENQNDEFYTQLKDIEAELKYYSNSFKEKTVFCNCDDPFKSNFTLFFLIHFNKLGLKRLISTGYMINSINNHIAYCLDISNIKNNKEDLNINEASQILQNKTNFTILKGDTKYLAGDFRSEESLLLLQQADIIVGNPPFSLFREYINLLEKYNKKYLFIGDINQITDKLFFPLIENEKVWMGVTMNGTGSHWFEVPTTYQNKYVQIINGKRMMTNGRACWWTNLDYSERHKIQPLNCQYNGHELNYPIYDNYEAIDIGYETKTGNRRGDFLKTPYDYKGVMGIPITALGKICPEQFKIIGLTASWCETPIIKSLKTSKKKRHNPILNGKEIYRRLLIYNRQPNRTDWEIWQHEIDKTRKNNN